MCRSLSASSASRSAALEGSESDELWASSLNRFVTVVAHQGDAHWAACDREEAIKRWNEAALIADTFSLLDHPFEIPPDVEAQYTEEATLCREKVRAANEDRDPLAIAQPGEAAQNTTP